MEYQDIFSLMDDGISAPNKDLYDAAIQTQGVDTRSTEEIVANGVSFVMGSDCGTFPILYKKGKKGEIRQWRVWTSGATIYNEYGQVGGEMQIATKIAQPKNVGRSNATTPEQQAILEAKAEWTKQKDRQGYRETVAETEERLMKPMLAEKFSEHKNKVVYPVHIQPKLDGLRCLAYWKDTHVVLQSRRGKFFDLPHISEVLEEIMPMTAVLDGELYQHGTPLMTLNSWIKRQQPESKNIRYNVYDVPCWNSDGYPWHGSRGSRFMDLSQTLARAIGSLLLVPISIVSTWCAENEQEVLDFEQKFVERGYEGAIVRQWDGLYLWGPRSQDLLKVKSFVDNEFKVYGFKGGDPGTKEEPCVIWICRADNGKEFSVRPMGSLESREELLKNAKDYIGRLLTVKYAYLTPDGIPFHPVGKGFRIDEDLPEE